MECPDTGDVDQFQNKVSSINFVQSHLGRMKLLLQMTDVLEREKAL
jgi:hypothetical protein